MALNVFQTQFKIAKPYPAASTDPQEFLHAGQWRRSKNATHHDAKHDVNNSSNLLLSQFEQAHVRSARQVSSGCLKSKCVRQCGKDLIWRWNAKSEAKLASAFKITRDVLQKPVISPLVEKCSTQIVYVDDRVDKQTCASKDFYVKATEKLFKLTKKNQNALQRTVN